MAKDETGIGRITQEGDHLRIQGSHEGVPSDFKVWIKHVEEERQKGGEKGLRAYLERNLDLGRVDRVYDPHTGELRGH